MNNKKRESFWESRFGMQLLILGYCLPTFCYLLAIGYSEWGAFFVLLISALSSLVTGGIIEMTDSPLKKQMLWVAFAVLVFMSWVLPLLMKPAVDWVFGAHGSAISSHLQ